MFDLDETVWVRDYSEQKSVIWTNAKIIKILGCRTYIVELPDGRIWKRHVNQIRKHVPSKELQTISQFPSLPVRDEAEEVALTENASRLDRPIRIRKAPERYTVAH